MATKIYEGGNSQETPKTYSPLLEDTFPQVRLRKPRRGFKKPPRFPTLAALAAAPPESQAITLAGIAVAVITSLFLFLFMAKEQNAVKDQYEEEIEMDLALNETLAAIDALNEAADDKSTEVESVEVEESHPNAINDVVMAAESPATIEEELTGSPTQIHYFVLR